MPLFAHPNFLYIPHQSFIFPSYAEAFAIGLAGLCSIPPSLEPKTRYHPKVEIFIDDEARKANV